MEDESYVAVVEVADFFEDGIVFCFFGSGGGETT
jgi:hypothetical protein